MSFTAVYPSPIDATTVLATSKYNTSYWPHYAADPAEPLTGTHQGNQWCAANGWNTNQKFNLDLGSAQVVTRIYLENGHSSGTATTMGIKNFSVYGTNSSTAFSNVTYADTTDLTLLGTFQASEHVAVDVSDPEYFDLSSNTTAYRYIVFRIADNWGFTNYMGIRHVEMQTGEADIFYIQNHLDQLYGAGPVQGAIDNIYSITTDLQKDIENIYSLKLQGSAVLSYTLSYDLLGITDLLYGVKLLGTLVQPYESAATPQGILVNYYGDAAQLMAKLVQWYGNAGEIRGSLDMDYGAPQWLAGILEQRYAITANEVQGVLDAVWDLHQYNPVQGVLDNVYAITSSDADSQAVSLAVTASGVAVDPHLVDYEATRPEFAMSVEIHLASHADFLVCQKDADLVVTVDGQAFNFFIESRRRNVRHGETTYIVTGLSKTAKMDAPYALPLRQEIGPGLASTLAQALATPYGITVDWQAVDAYIPSGKWYANDETPLAALRRLVKEWGAMLQTSPAGDLVVRQYYPVSPPPTYNGRANWNTVSPAAYLTALDNFFMLDDPESVRPGYNRYLITDKLATADTMRLEEETVSASVKNIKGFVTPWDDSAELQLTTSGGSWVQIEPLGIRTEEITETVEFVNGTGNAAKPVYAISSMTWKETSLGGVAFAEDGLLQADVAGQSLLELTYTTKYHLWRATDQYIEDVQFVLEEV